MHSHACLMNTVQDKILEGENFGEFGKFYPICQNFPVQLKKLISKN